MPCVSASRPVAALSQSGIVVRRRGSMTVMSGTSARPRMVILVLRVVSVTMQNCETSAPVPDVDGTTTSGGIGSVRLVHALVVEDVSAVGGEDRHALGGVDHRSATDRHEHIAAVFGIDLMTGGDLVVFRVGGQVAPHPGVDALRLQVADHLVSPARLDEPGVGDEHRPQRAQSQGGMRGFGHRVDSEDDLRGVELQQPGRLRGRAVVAPGDERRCHRRVPRSHGVQLCHRSALTTARRAHPL